MNGVWSCDSCSFSTTNDALGDLHEDTRQGHYVFWHEFKE